MVQYQHISSLSQLTMSHFSVSYNPGSNSLLASSADRSVRQYDPREGGGGQIVTGVYTSHTGWVSQVGCLVSDWSECFNTVF